MSVDDNIKDIGSQNVPIPEIPKPENIKDELTQVSGASIEDRVTEKKRDAILNLINDVTAQREDIDKIMSAIPQILDKVNILAGTVDKQSEAINILIKGGGATATPGAAGGMDLDKVEAISGILEKVADVYTKIKGGNQNTQAPLISQELINEKMQKAFMDDLNTGESIRSFITDSLKRKATRDIVKSSLSTMGDPDHGPV